jgi:hypothetical protein
MSTKKNLCAFMTLIAGLVTITNLANFTALAQQQTHRVSMSSIDLPIVLAMIVAAGVIGGVVFIVLAAAELARRRRRKFSCIQH